MLRINRMLQIFSVAVSVNNKLEIEKNSFNLRGFTALREK